jgi:hypothetical protein
MRDANFYDPRHPHEPEVAPVFDPEGRCLVCGCQWRDQQIDRLYAFIENLVQHMRAHAPECSLLPENTEDDPGWILEAHGHPEWVDEGPVPSVPYVPGPDDHGIVRRLP